MYENKSAKGVSGMSISENISEIISKRKEKVPRLLEKKKELEEIEQEIESLDLIRQNMLEKKDQLKIGSEVRDALYNINTTDFENSINRLLKSYEDTIARFSRNEINIAVVGTARQGKSKLLQAISNLDNKVIPAFSDSDCTGASSVIKNMPGQPIRAEIRCRSEIEMVEAVQAYLDNIFGNDFLKLESFESIGKLSVIDLEKEIPRGSEKTTKFEHLKKYIEHFDEWKELIHKREITVTKPEEIQKYVAQHNDEKENSPQRENYYYYLAVKEAVIFCEFNNSDAGSIVLRDTIGLGDTSLGISEKMLETIGVHSDAAIIVRRPETATGKLDNSDEKLYEELNRVFGQRNMGKWLFWLINRTGKDSPYGDNYDRCEAFKAKIDSLNWSIAQISIVDVNDKNAVNNDFLPSVLNLLIQNINDIDRGIMIGVQKKSDEAFSEFKKLQGALKKVLISGASEVIDKADFMDEKWDELYESGLMKLLKEYKEELEKKKAEESVEFKNKVIEILKHSNELIPSEQELVQQLKKGGKNRGIDVYTMRLDKLRTEFTREFINIDEEVFDKQVEAFKSRIVEIFASDQGGKLGHLMPVSDYSTPDEWLKKFADRYFNKVRYEQFKVAFIMLSEFSLTVRGFLMHRIRDCIDRRLNPTDYGVEYESDVDEAKKLKLNMSKKLKSVKEELLQKFQDELFKEPNSVFYAIISEFYDRINFSYQEKFKDAENIWEKFYVDHIEEIWSDEFEEKMRLNDMYKDWTQISDIFSKISKNNFTVDI